MIMKSLFAAALATSLMAGSALAQNQGNQGGLVNVKVGDIGIAALNNTTVQVPIGIAAQVCGVDANVIAQDRDNALTNCTVDQEAANANQAFLDFVQKKN
jgi:hypothetical protein